VLRAVSNGVHRPRIGLRTGLKPAFQQDDELAFARGRWAIQEQNAPPNVGAHGGGFKIFHHPGQGLIDANRSFSKKV